MLNILKLYITTEITEASCLLCLQLWLHEDFLLQSGFFQIYMFTSKDMSTLNVLIRLRYALWSVEKQHLMKIVFFEVFYM